MTRITVSTVRDKRKEIKHQFFHSHVLKRDFICGIQSFIFTYRKLAFGCNSLNVKDIHKEGNMAFGLICFSFMLNTEGKRDVYV